MLLLICVKSVQTRSYSGPYFPVFGRNTGKYGPEITPYLDTFHTVLLYRLSSTKIYVLVLLHSLNFNFHKLWFLSLIGTMVRKKMYSPFEVYILSMNKNKSRKRYFQFGRSYGEGYVYLFIISVQNYRLF